MTASRTLMFLTAAFLLFGNGIASAACVREGKVSRLTVTAGGTGNWVNIMDTSDFPAFASWFPVSAVYLPTLSAAFAANQKVKVTGSAAACGPVLGGFSAGGNVTGVDIFLTH